MIMKGVGESKKGAGLGKKGRGFVIDVGQARAAGADNESFWFFFSGKEGARGEKEGERGKGNL